MKSIPLVVLIFLLAFAGCEGERGPAGPAGPEGPAGSPGGAQRIVYDSGATIPGSPNPYVVSVPEIDFEHAPVIEVYVVEPPGIPNRRFWRLSITDNGTGRRAQVREGQVLLYDCHDLYYRIVLVL